MVLNIIQKTRVSESVIAWGPRKVDVTVFHSELVPSKFHLGLIQFSRKSCASDSTRQEAFVHFQPFEDIEITKSLRKLSNCLSNRSLAYYNIEIPTMTGYSFYIRFHWFNFAQGSVQKYQSSEKFAANCSHIQMLRRGVRDLNICLKYVRKSC